MSCEGWLTFVDTTLGYCELERKTIINLSLLKLNDDNFKLPTIPTWVSVTRAVSPRRNEYICTEESTVEAKFETDFTSTVFIDLLKNNKGYAMDILHLACKVITMLKQNFVIKTGSLKQNLILEILKKIVIQNKPSFIHLKSANDCKSVKLHTTDYNNFPNWSFGIQCEDRSILFGCISISPIWGCLILQDGHYKFRLIIPNTCFKDLNAITESYVLIRNYKTFSEILNDAKIPNIEYLYVNFEDITVLMSKKKRNCLLYHKSDVPRNQIYTNVFQFILVRKSSVWIGMSLEPECYLEVLVTNGNSNVETGTTIFLTLLVTYVPILLHLKENNSYALHYHNLCVTTNTELEYIGNYNNFILLDKNAYFEELPIPPDDQFKEHVLTVQQCKQSLSSSTNLINVQGVIFQKRFANPLSSRTQKKVTPFLGFGITGFKTHILTFKFINTNGSNGYLDLYLANLENALNPLGLIPQMRVLIKNVMPQSNKYIKPTLFTSFEIISYEPKVNFNTPILNGGIEELNWGQPFSLGIGVNLPQNTMVWGTVTKVKVTKIQMENRCMCCNNMSDGSGPCPYCTCNIKHMNFYLQMEASDDYSEFKIIAKDPKILQDILEVPRRQFHPWWRAFTKLKSFTFNVFEPSNYNLGTDNGRFKNMLTQLLINANKAINRNMDIKCRFLGEKNGCAKFSYLDSRTNS